MVSNILSETLLVVLLKGKQELYALYVALLLLFFLYVFFIILYYLEHFVSEVGNSEPAKRQRRWNTETVKGPDAQSTTPRPATTPRDEPITLKRSFSRSDSSATDDTPKEHIGKSTLL